MSYLSDKAELQTLFTKAHLWLRELKKDFSFIEIPKYSYMCDCFYGDELFLVVDNKLDINGSSFETVQFSMRKGREFDLSLAKYLLILCVLHETMEYVKKTLEIILDYLPTEIPERQEMRKFMISCLKDMEKRLSESHKDD